MKSHLQRRIVAEWDALQAEVAGTAAELDALPPVLIAIHTVIH